MFSTYQLNYSPLSQLHTFIALKPTKMWSNYSVTQQSPLLSPKEVKEICRRNTTHRIVRYITNPCFEHSSKNVWILCGATTCWQTHSKLWSQVTTVNGILMSHAVQGICFLFPVIHRVRIKNFLFEITWMGVGRLILSWGRKSNVIIGMSCFIVWEI